MNTREQLLVYAVKAAMRLGADLPSPGSRVETLHIHGLSEGMCAAHRIHDVASDLFHRRIVSTITIAGGDGGNMPPRDKPGDGWPGEDWYRSKLEARNVPGAVIVAARKAVHTRDEADAFVTLAKERKWRSCLNLSVSYHGVRAMTCMVAAMHAQEYMMRMYFASTNSVLWNNTMKGSQGARWTTSAEELDVEIASILKYWERGAEGADSQHPAWKHSWGCTPEMLFEYLDTIRPGLSS